MARALAGVALSALLAWAVHTAARRRRCVLPAATVGGAEFRSRVRDGDLLLTRASNNWMSRLHSLGLGTPVAHVGIAVVETQGDAAGRVFMFESGAPRGSQLRDLDGYVQEGADYVWWRPLRVPDAVRARIRTAVERLSRSAYSWSFLADLPQEIVQMRAPFAQETDEDDVAELGAASCAELVARVYELAGVLAGGGGKRYRARWLPMHFLDDRALPWALNGGASPLDPPLNIVFPPTAVTDAARWDARVHGLARALVSSAAQ